MNIPAEHILLVESNPDIQGLIAHQALLPLGYQVHTVVDVNSALNQAAEFAPDLIIAGLNLSGLSGRDLLVALNSQKVQVPVIVVAEKGQENEVIQAFRLGAADYLLWPAREAEVVSAVERALKQVRESRTRQRLDLQLKEINQELRRVRELTATFNIGKAILSITDQDILFDKIVERVMYVTEADYGWILVRDEHTKTFILAAHSNLPADWADKLDQPLNDGISSQVALSGETLVISGEQLNRLAIASLGHSAMAAPIKIQREVVGILVVVRKSDLAFETTMQSILDAVANYASISIINARQLHSFQESAEIARASEQQKSEQLWKLQQEMQAIIQSATSPMELLLDEEIGRLSVEQRKALETVQLALGDAARLVADDQSTRSAAGQPIENG